MSEQDSHDYHDLYFLPQQEREAVIKDSSAVEGVRQERERELKDRLAKEKVSFVVGQLKERLFNLQLKLQEPGRVRSHNKWKSHTHTLALIGDSVENFIGTFSDLEIKNPDYYKYLFEIAIDVGY